MSAICIILGCLGLALFVLPLFVSSFNAGNAAGILLSAGVILYGCLRNRCPAGLKRVLFGIVLAGLVLMLAEGILMVRAAAAKPADNCTVIVLGCRVRGTEPSLMLKKRIMAAEAYLREHPEAVCICSGGQGADEAISEAECIYRELMAAGIAGERLYKEEKSTSTAENIAFSKDIIREKGLSEAVALATSDYHCYRALRQAKEQGLSAFALPAHTRAGLMPVFFLRECMAILKEWIF